MGAIRLEVGLLLVLVLVLGVAPPAQAAETTLRWKLRKGETLRYRLTADQRVEYPSAIGGEPVVTTQKTRIGWRLAVREIDIGGNARVQCRFDEVAVDMDQLVLGRIVWDSARREDMMRGDDPSVKPFLALVGQEFGFTLGADGAVREVGGYDKVIGAVLAGLGDNPIAVAALGSGFGEEAARAALERSFAILPAGPVAEGARWTRASEQAIPILGVLRYETEFALSGILSREAGAGIAKIAAKTKIAAAPAPAAPEGGGPGATPAVKSPLGDAIEATFLGGAGESTIDFSETGALVRSESRFEMKVRSRAKPPTAPAEGPGAEAVEVAVRETVTVERVVE